MNLMKIVTRGSIFQSLSILCAVSCVMILSACGGGGDSSGDSAGSSSVGAPTSLIGNKVVMNVAQSGYVPGSPGSTINIVQPGGTVTYTLVDSSTIIGTGVQTIPTLSFTYVLSGNVGTLSMNMTYGTTKDVYTFTSPTGGTWSQTGSLTTGTTFYFSGTFTISPSSSTTGGTTTGGTTTGQIAVWTARSTFQTSSIQVKIDGVAVGGLTQYYTSTPTCGGSGTITKTLAVGAHSLTAVDGTMTWTSGSFNITAGGCLTYQLM
jgi:hypothetical protein